MQKGGEERGLYFCETAEGDGGGAEGFKAKEGLMEKIVFVFLSGCTIRSSRIPKCESSLTAIRP